MPSAVIVPQVLQVSPSPHHDSLSSREEECQRLLGHAHRWRRSWSTRPGGFRTVSTIMIWRGFRHYWPFVRGIHWWPADSHRKRPMSWMFPLPLTCTCCWTNIRVASDLKLYDAHETIVMLTQRTHKSISHKRWMQFCCCFGLPWLYFNSLWPSDAIWRYSSMSTLARVMVCCLTAPGHHLNQCWLMISEVLWHSPDSNFTENA